ncbi:MAG TPA: SMC family ATPase [Longimicrobium sp.]|nr:SMC family ATPase [Longimicrobium sp.]
MRLLTLRMRNFRQHADSEITFRGGLTGIIGPNGAGKSTILEAIAWSIYGAQAARGTNETIRFSRAGPRTRVEVELRFALGGHEYRVVRSMHQAEVYLDGSAQPVAATLAGATLYLQSRIGMTRDEFFNTYFTGQKELQFLAAMGPTERGRFLSQVLGYERLARAQKLARERRSELAAEIKGLRASLGDVEELEKARFDAEVRVGEAVGELKAAREEMEDAAAALKAMLPRWEKAQADRDRHRELTHLVESAERERQGALRDVERARAELDAIAKAEAELAPVRERLAVLPSLAEQAEALAEAARKEERRKALAAQLADLDAELARGAERIARLENAPELEKRYAAELTTLRAEHEAADADAETKRSTWLTDRQDAHTKLTTYRDRARELREQIRNIEELGPQGTCPTCGRPVGKDYARILEELREQYADVVQDGKWWSSRFDQLKEKPEELAALEAKVKELAEQVDDRAHRHTRCQAAVQELETLAGERKEREARRKALAKELKTLPEGYDPKLHREVDATLRQLRAVEKEATRLEEKVARRVDREREMEEARAREAEAVKRAKEASSEREKLGFSDEEFASVKGGYEAAGARHRQCELRATELRGVVATAEQAVQTAIRAVEQYHERAAAVVAQETELRYHEELDHAYTELRQELNDTVRPELSEIGSLFLAQLTDGRYTAMEIDEGYNILVLDEGEEKPVISGGEEDIANLVLRLSLSQMIAERAGHPLSLLILDEVFGSLDVARRDNVVQLLHHLEDRFEQVILITHIEGIRESLDQVLRVEYDERAGTSLVREETNAGDDFFPEAPMAAD